MSQLFFLPRYQLSVALAGLGVWLMMMQPFPTSPTFDALAAVADEYVWGVGFIVVGVSSFLTMYRERHKPYNVRRHRIRLAAHSMVSMCWFAIVVFIAISNIRSTGTYIYLFLAVQSTLSLIEMSGVVSAKKKILRKLDAI